MIISEKNLIDTLRYDIREMLELQRKYAELQTKINYSIRVSDKHNYNPELSDLMNIKSQETMDKLNELKAKWGV